MFVRNRNGTIIPPYNDLDVVVGQGTIAVEMLEQQPNLDAIIVPVSGGGMLAGVAAAAKSIKPSIRVFAVEPEGKQLGRSLALGEQGWMSASARDRLLDTIADAIRTKVGRSHLAAST